jgi:hypothetical protein
MRARLWVQIGVQCSTAQHKKEILSPHTVENRTSEEHEELDEQVLLLGHNLVPAESLAASFDISVGETLLDVGVQPFLGNNTGLLSDGGLLLPEL